MSREEAVSEVRQQLALAAAAKKCHGCGCLHETVEALGRTAPGRGGLADAVAASRAIVVPRQYDCLGCTVCYPALAANAFREAYPGEGESMDACPVDTPEERRGWPPLPGSYRVLRWGAPVAICTLNSEELAEALARRAPEGVALVGTLHTENLGIERLVQNVLANPNIRELVLCGADTRQAVGHLPGRSLECLFASGVDEGGRIVDAPGKRPILRNVTREQVRTFRRQVTLVPLVGEEREDVILERVAASATAAPGPFAEETAGTAATDVEMVHADEPRRLTLDPAGFFVVYPDARRSRLVLEHYTNAGVLDQVIGGASPAALAATAVERRLVTRLDHAAYLGRELARAERSLATGEPYVQDRAPGEIGIGREVEEPRPAPATLPAAGCGCAGACAPGGESR